MTCALPGRHVPFATAPDLQQEFRRESLLDEDKFFQAHSSQDWVKEGAGGPPASKYQLKFLCFPFRHFRGTEAPVDLG